MSNFRKEFESSKTAIVTSDGNTVGFVQTVENDDEIYLRYLALVPEAQGRGLGTDLIKNLQANAAGRGLPIRLSMLRTNSRVAKLYERLGFVPSEESDSFTEMIWRDSDSS